MSEMGVWRKILVYLGLVEEPAEEDYPGVPPTDAGAEAARAAAPRVHDEPAARPGNVRTLPVGAGRQPDRTRALDDQRPTAAREIAIVRATSFDQAAEEVGALYRDGRSVLLDVAAVDAGVGRRLLDFTSGVVYALHGRIARADRHVFLVLQEGAEIPADERRRLGGLGYSVAATPDRQR